MHPILFSFGPITVHTYGFLIAIGFLAGVSTVRRLSEWVKLDPQKMVDLSFWLLLTGFMGARILFVLTQLDYFMEHPMAVFYVWEGGLVFFGGLISALMFGMWFVYTHKIMVWRAADVLLPGVVIAHAFGRLGCLGAGCCYGKPTGTDFGIKFYSDLVDPSLRGVNLHPTQLYESAALFILFAGLILLSKRKSFDGQVALTYFITYPIIRSIIEVFRGDLVRGFVVPGTISTSQFISIIILVAATGFLIYRLRQLHKNPGASA